DYQKVVEMCQQYLTNLGPDADAFFNLAVSYLELKDYQKAKEFFFKAVELDRKFQEYTPFFENL
ncbi:tetratricopeptide repeat protein, partial [Patescibacteria group bacterium]|nr:tetratricopeptide repeat protein [Patescibacteria group bacterium]